MAWIYLAASEESDSPFRHGSGQSPIVKETDTPKPCFFRELLQEKSTTPRSGTMSKRSKGGGCRKSTSSSEASPVKISARQEMALDWQASEAAYFSRSCGLSMKLDPDSFSWKMSQQSLFADLEQSPQKLPAAGMIVGGQLFPLLKLGRITGENDGGFWPTPVANDDNKSPEAHMEMKARMKGGPRKKCTSLNVMVKGVERGMWPAPRANERGDYQRDRGEKGKERATLTGAVKLWPTPNAAAAKNRGSLNNPCIQRLIAMGKQVDLGMQAGGQLNPTWVEWLMGYPLGWTELSALATAWFRSVRGKRLKN